MKATVKITLKYGVLDPQGKAIEKSLGQLGFSGVNEVRQGKLIELDIDADTPEAAEKQITEMCEKLLANTVIENYDIQLNLAE
ncbi:MAG: phosphoribosylformylglycinamidine synthase subunit PurS [Candidatus Micropelagos sp.]|jgi:phosphoribosylformylglycinamidine synthase|uniref:Phosphoribosylformylglycinamidine synthase subunit PurS n=1 Tax=PS1 clade bacterium TaxID=2175152 RepID=A0A368E1P0_9PROT|nr:phosphoribosylformylglycinamidine synthase subunit PurS [Candidatus Micropelagos sp.]NCG10309.1 phosphoribosylformylglycinamidine synthase subunit PurS [Alphaproteobacteria bacterium]OUX19056.1 MAG: phosphoribosylformylglycinamidine synthase [Rhizobiales bacterium TMED249]RCL77375.1 MAG: phosphoribosylformylglycinamidine synthase subunit PurS [PS1 clade bacterium]HCN32609.1 phosphoribosylformylglycinamidine synthase [Rhodobiaceae bacterium]|tara:strand:- start:4446 stop:4694 length:249 start_codon:yes stop_codon:yes gene_type:complete